LKLGLGAIFGAEGAEECDSGESTHGRWFGACEWAICGAGGPAGQSWACRGWHLHASSGQHAHSPRLARLQPTGLHASFLEPSRAPAL